VIFVNALSTMLVAVVPSPFIISVSVSLVLFPSIVSLASSSEAAIIKVSFPSPPLKVIFSVPKVEASIVNFPVVSASPLILIMSLFPACVPSVSV